MHKGRIAIDSRMALACYRIALSREKWYFTNYDIFERLDNYKRLTNPYDVEQLLEVWVEEGVVVRHREFSSMYTVP